MLHDLKLRLHMHAHCSPLSTIPNKLISQQHHRFRCRTCPAVSAARTNQSIVSRLEATSKTKNRPRPLPPPVSLRFPASNHCCPLTLARTNPTNILPAMICPRCLLQAARAPALRTSALLTPVLPSTLRHLSTTRAPLSPETASTNPPAATSTSAAQPFSAGTAPAIATKDLTPVSATPAITSSVAAGTVLRGLNYFKNKPDPVALEDAAYPAWLWEVLAEKKSAVNEGAPQLDPRLFCTSFVPPPRSPSARSVLTCVCPQRNPQRRAA